MDDQNTRVQQDGDDEEFSINIWEWIRFLLVHRFFIGAVTAVFTVIGVLVALSSPSQYTATATVLPPQSSNSKLSGLLSSFSGIVGDIGGVGGNMSQIYPDIAKSRTVLDGLLQAKYEGRTYETVLKERYKLKGADAQNELISMLQQGVQVSSSVKTDVTTVSVTDRDPKLAAALVNEILNQMEHYFKVSYKSSASSQTMMIEARLKEVSDALRAKENQLMYFHESNRILTVAPRLQVSEARLERDMQINNALYTELSRQHELAKISELQLKPVLNILDRATPPSHKSKPSRKKIVLLFIIVGFVVSVTYLKASPVIYNEVVCKLKHSK